MKTLVRRKDLQGRLSFALFDGQENRVYARIRSGVEGKAFIGGTDTHRHQRDRDLIFECSAFNQARERLGNVECDLKAEISVPFMPAPPRPRPGPDRLGRPAPPSRAAAAGSVTPQF